MSAGVNHQEASMSGPSHEYPSPNEAHELQGTGAYYNHRSQRAFDDNEDMQMATSLSHDMQHNLGAQMSSAAAISNGHGHAQEMVTSPSVLGAPGMAPPQTPTQPSHMGQPVQQGGAEGTQESGPTADSTRRKRSKVSRACDECRRKKIRCDATGDDGIVNTCSNCQRVGQTCSFSRVPMKRGPSKGYIKELSERVQQVESQMALSGPIGPTGYRSSMDASSPSGAYPDVFSPDEAMPLSLKRTISLSDSKNPFAQPHFTNRDRMPSTGGWSVNSSVQGSRSQGPRGSIAIAPDQQLPDINPTTNGQFLEWSKPFWAQDNAAEPPLKKRKRNVDDDSAALSTLTLEIGAETFAPYFNSVHSTLPILPKAIEDVTTHIQMCPAKQKVAFLYALGAACGPKMPPQAVFQSYGQLEEFAWSEARENPVFRSASENIVWLWTYLFMLVTADNDLSRLRGSRNNTLAKDRLIKMAVDLGRFAIKHFKQEIPPESEGLAISVVLIARQAWNCVGILARLHAIGTATDDDIPLTGVESVGSARDCELLSEEASFLSRSSGILAILSTTIQDNLMSYTGSRYSVKTRLLIQQHLDHAVHATPDTDAVTTLIEQFRLLVTILLSRHTAVLHEVDILDPTLELVDSLRSNTTVSAETPTFKPLDVHLYTLATITLLEFTDLADIELSQAAWEGLETVRLALEQVAERAHADTQERYAGTGLGDPPLHWADGLLRTIDSKPRVNTSDNEVLEAVTNGGEPTTHQSELQRLPGTDDAQRHIEKVGGVNTGQLQTIDFAMLTRHGYLNVLADRAGA